MKSKITLVTAPDFFENQNESILFIGLTEEEQEAISQWFASKDFNRSFNFYVSDHEHNTPWLLYALARCEHKYINLDQLNYLTQTLAGYILAGNNVYYKTDNDTIANVVKHINSNRSLTVIGFLEANISG